MSIVDAGYAELGALEQEYGSVEELDKRSPRITLEESRALARMHDIINEYAGDPVD